MNVLIKKIIFGTISVCAHLYTLNIHQLLNGYQDEVYSLWMRRFIHGRPQCFIRKGVNIEGINYVQIGEGTQIGRCTLIEALVNRKGQASSPLIKIGRNCSIGYDNHITAMGTIIIGDGLLTGRHVLISDNNHTGKKNEYECHPQDRSLTSKGSIIIGRNVWIGENSSILGGVKIGDGAIIATNAVVTHDVPPLTIVAGVPARVVKKLDH